MTIFPTNFTINVQLKIFHTPRPENLCKKVMPQFEGRKKESYARATARRIAGDTHSGVG